MRADGVDFSAVRANGDRGRGVGPLSRVIDDRPPVRYQAVFLRRARRRTALPSVRRHRGSYEEYYPHGSTAWWAGDSDLVGQKRYKYTGMERDEETGLQRHGVRYYATWIGRWTSSDPIGLGGGINRYGYCSGDPVGSSDRGGTTEVDAAMDRQEARDTLADPDNAAGMAIRTAAMDQSRTEAIEALRSSAADYEIELLDLDSDTLKDSIYRADQASYNSLTGALALPRKLDLGVASHELAHWVINETHDVERLVRDVGLFLGDRSLSSGIPISLLQAPEAIFGSSAARIESEAIGFHLENIVGSYRTAVDTTRDAVEQHLTGKIDAATFDSTIRLIAAQWNESRQADVGYPTSVGTIPVLPDALHQRIERTFLGRELSSQDYFDDPLIQRTLAMASR